MGVHDCGHFKRLDGLEDPVSVAAGTDLKITLMSSKSIKYNLLISIASLETSDNDSPLPVGSIKIPGNMSKLCVTVDTSIRSWPNPMPRTK
jgi:hypothetical protein